MTGWPSGSLVGGSRCASGFAVMTGVSAMIPSAIHVGYQRGIVWRPSDLKYRMGDAINGASHNAPVNMATNNPNRPAVANSASFAMDHGYPSRRVRHPVNTQFSGLLSGTRARVSTRLPVANCARCSDACSAMRSPAAACLVRSPRPQRGGFAGSAARSGVRTGRKAAGPANSNSPFYSNLIL
jgi:hypothetical protein